MNGSKESDMRLAGYEALGYAVVEQAVSDIKLLRFNGLLSKSSGELTKNWASPSGKPVRCWGYGQPCEVVQLLYWFRNKSDDWLTMIGAQFSGDTMCKALKLIESDCGKS